MTNSQNDQKESDLIKTKKDEMKIFSFDIRDALQAVESCLITQNEIHQQIFDLNQEMGKNQSNNGQEEEKILDSLSKMYDILENNI